VRPVVFNITIPYNGFMKEMPAKLHSSLIAPCGMNCGVCIAHLRERKPCHGCNGLDTFKPAHCVQCSIKKCADLQETASGFCVECSKFPCPRLKHLDKRYRTKYGMSMIENLETIKALGMNAFIKQEKSHWTCANCGATLCTHREVCLSCGEKFKKRVYLPLR
jgi:hypothetical protein